MNILLHRPSPVRALLSAGPNEGASSSTIGLSVAPVLLWNTHDERRKLLSSAPGSMLSHSVSRHSSISRRTGVCSSLGAEAAKLSSLLFSVGMESASRADAGLGYIQKAGKGMGVSMLSLIEYLSCVFAECRSFAVVCCICISVGELTEIFREVWY